MHVDNITIGSDAHTNIANTILGKNEKEEYNYSLAKEEYVKPFLAFFKYQLEVPMKWNAE